MRRLLVRSPTGATDPRPLAPRVRVRRGAALLVIATSLAFAPVASADGAADKARAKAIAASGVADYEAGRYEQALARMREADALFDAPHHDVYAARALKQLGRWVEAREAYRAAIDAKEDRPGFEDARALALEELAQLERALPSVIVRTRGATLARVTVDGRAVTPNAEGRVSVDPGSHMIAVETTDGRRDEQGVDVAARGEARVTFDLPSVGGALEEKGESPSYLVPIVAFGVGGAGLAVGLVTGVASLARVDDLATACPAQECPPALQGDIDSANTLANVSNVGFAIGAVGVAVGLVSWLVIDAESGPSSAARALQPHPGGGAWRTTF